MRKFGLPALVLILVLGQLLAASPASANAPANKFTADALPTWQTDGVVWALATTPGLVFAGGQFTTLRSPGATASTPRNNVAVLDAGTGVPTGCTIDVARGTASSIVRALVVSPDQRTLYLGGMFSTVKGVARQNLAAVDIATCTVLPFNPRPSSFVFSLAASATTVYFGGAFSSVNGLSRTRLAAAAAGAVATVTGWKPTADDDIFALAIDRNNGNIIVGGQHNRINSTLSPTLAIVDGNVGGLVKVFPANTFPWTDGTGLRRLGMSVTKSITQDANGFYIGNECYCNADDNFEGRAAFSWNYSQRWRDNCQGATQAVTAYEGTLFSASHAHDCSSEGWFGDGPRHHFLSETTAAKQILPWFPNSNDGINERIGPRAMTVATKGSSVYLWSGGEFTTVNGVAQQGLVRFGQGPDVGAPLNLENPTATASRYSGITVRWRTSLDTDDASLRYTVYRNGSTTPIATVSATSYIWSRPQVSFNDQNVQRGQTYSYRIRASDGTNTTPSSNSVSITAQ